MDFTDFYCTTFPTQAEAEWVGKKGGIRLIWWDENFTDEILLTVNCDACGSEDQFEIEDVLKFAKSYCCPDCAGRSFSMYRPAQSDYRFCPLCDDFANRYDHHHFKDDYKDLQAWLDSGRSIEDWIPLSWVRFWEQEEAKSSC
jgi:hypothetical protein